MPFAHDPLRSATSQRMRESNVREASNVSTTTARNAVEPQAAFDEASDPNVMSGTNTAIVNGSTFDQRPISVMKR